MLRLKGKLLWRGMRANDAFSALKLSGKWEYVANVENEYWFRCVKFGDVIEVIYDGCGIVRDIDILWD